MTKTIHCDIVSAHGEIFSGEVAMLFASGIAGDLGISPRHAPLITQLKAGPVRIQDEAGEEQFYFVSGGILEVQPHVVTVMADTAMRGEDLDQAAAQAAKAEAERELADRTGEMEIAEAQAKLVETIEQLRALEQWRRRVQHKK